jgi:putative membrane protein
MAYTHNEMGEFLKNTFQLSRNPYDRIVHFSFGFLMAYPLKDYLDYKFPLSKKYLSILVNMIILCLATIFELIEWGVAAFTDSATGETYVATQGDPWDA